MSSSKRSLSGNGPPSCSTSAAAACPSLTAETSPAAIVTSSSADLSFLCIRGWLCLRLVFWLHLQLALTHCVLDGQRSSESSEALTPAGGCSATTSSGRRNFLSSLTRPTSSLSNNSCVRRARCRASYTGSVAQHERSTRNTYVSGSKFLGMMGRGTASPPASMGCLATTAFDSLSCLGVPFKFSNSTTSQRSSSDFRLKPLFSV